MDNIKNFLNAVSVGDNITAQQHIGAELSAKAFDALEVRKQEIAGSLFGGQTETTETESETTEE